MDALEDLMNGKKGEEAEEDINSWIEYRRGRESVMRLGDFQKAEQP